MSDSGYGRSAPATHVAHSSEYKQVTVLFADVVHSMDIAASLDMERFRELMTELLERLAAVVQCYGGTVEYTGDGVMAIFGAPVALEDHAFRACLVALSIQEEADRLATEVRCRDAVDLHVRVGLNSGRVIAGELGSGLLGYRATGQHVGLAQRMESVAPPGGVMLSESTARLVEHVAVLGAPESLYIKGAEEPVTARRLLAIKPREGGDSRAEASLLGRRWEMAALDAIMERAIGGCGGVVGVQGPPGIGKSRVAREAAAAAITRGVDVFWAFCESHAADHSFQAVVELLLAGAGIGPRVDQSAARARVREQHPDAHRQDLLLLDDLLGIADPNVDLPQIDPDARRRRLTALIKAWVLAHTAPALYIIEDAHWIDAISESMIADLLTVISQTRLMVLITARPEYEGALIRSPGTHTIGLAPLANSDIAALLAELLGSDPSVAQLAPIIAERAAGNPFFVEEMVRELAQRGVLAGERGCYVCQADIAELSVPPTVQAAIEARIDRLGGPAKLTLHAASVIGARFGADMLGALGIDAVLDELLRVELIDQVQFMPTAEYAFHHPLIRAVAYESQLKSDRARWHRRLAAAIQEHEPGSAENHASLIAEHLESAGELREAYGWHMRAGAWLTDRDFGAARLSWQRARRIADALPADDPEQLSMRITPRTMLCVTGGLARAVREGQDRFAELQDLCSTAGDTVSLAIAMTGLAAELFYAGRSREATRRVSEQMALLESIGDPAPLMGLAFGAFCIWFDGGQFDEILRWSQTVIDLAEGDPTKGAGFGVGSPLAVALGYRGVARWWLGKSGWHEDLNDAVAMARRSTAATFAGVVTWAYGFAIQYGVLPADGEALLAIEEALTAAEESTNDVSLSLAQYALGVALLSRDDVADRNRGLEIVMQNRDMWLRVQASFMIPVVDILAARETARRGDCDSSIPVMYRAVDDLLQAGRLGYGVLGASTLVETLLERGAEGDMAEAQAQVDRLTNLSAEGAAMPALLLLRLRALLSRAHGDDISYQDYLTRYHAMAKSLGFERHIAGAEEMMIERS